jgi:hypothetical protein
LGPRCTDSGAFRTVQNTKLNATFIRGQGHGTPQGVNFFDQVAFADTTNGRVAAHLTQGLDVVGQQKRFATHARRRQRSLGPCMATANNDHIKFLWIKHQITRTALLAGAARAVGAYGQGR